jgi:hypothetical protein
MPLRREAASPSREEEEESTTGAAVVQRSVASSAAAAPLPLSRVAGEGRGGGVPPAPVNSVMEPAIVRRSPDSPAAAPAMPLRQESAPLSREAGEGRGGGAPVASAAVPPAVQASPSVTMGPAIIHRSAAGPAAARPLTPSPSPIAHPSAGRGGQGVRGSGSIHRSPAPEAPRAGLPSPAATLPLPMGRTRIDGGGAAIVQAMRAAAASSAAPPSAPSPAPTLSASVAGVSMPLARSASTASSGTTASGTPSGGGVIQRQAAEGDEGGSSSSSSLSEEAGTGISASAPSGAGASGTDVEEVVEKVMRRLTRNLAVESERQGGRRWPYRS